MFKRALMMAIVPALALTVAVLGPAGASAESLVPFHATVYETYTAALCGTSALCITAVGTGEATHLGEITESASVVVDINPADLQNGCAPETRTTTLTAANGDTITMFGTGSSCAATSAAHDNYSVTGGSGRYQGASGNGSDYNVHRFTGPGVGVATVTYDGIISSVGSLVS